mmetsp:Transcript_20114/g.26101  ORF Transcript_20114/g.26101 Transcript_20114/m.26101 type:complete len:412 (+) Transcript_20114:79-1314(+)|eukprot:CAMPEP_0184026774 /NCGR_PEP_ID=MMETSP0954-20121128/13745_1 /TAXON_ID=627963 /ORGANISM="Aplanochytrium sp, Strain PBS07" /LENGTH=411 /DNA_ID=CAMNT_0026311091 /DNA_START=29 /DNA_END=1264 /DNA_ORIENTATION=+
MGSEDFTDQTAETVTGVGDHEIDEEGLLSTGIELGYAVSLEEAELTAETILTHSNPAWLDWDGGIVGGKPSWLSPLTCTNAKKTQKDSIDSLLKCRACGSSLSFLLQVYAPKDGIEQAFHRSLYVFVCRNKPSCVRSGKGVQVLRAQLCRQNKFYPEKGDEDSASSANWNPVNETDVVLGRKFTPPFLLEVETEKLSPEEVKLHSSDTSVDEDCQDVEPKCTYCGTKNVKLFKCSRCRCVTYCNKEHQKAHWKDHKKNCKLLAESKEQKEADQLEDAKLGQEDLDSIAAGANDAIAKRLNNKDNAFVTFQKRVQLYPEQILRYSCWPIQKEKLNGPLLITEDDCAAMETVPPCPLCGCDREFEMQIMPQILHVLAETYLDWGIICIYTCQNSCTISSDSNYVPEVALVQCT